MGNIGTPITTDIPAVGTSGTTYARELNEFLTEVQDRLEAEVPKSSLEAGALDMDSNAVQNTSYVGITNGGSAPTTPANSVQAYDGDMYWVNTGGAVQITDGTTLNTALVGGITGDYGGANPAQFRFVDADQEFYAYDNYAGGAYARVWAKNFDLAAASTGAVRVRLAYGGAGSYTFTLPGTLPISGNTSFLKIDENGQVSSSNSVLGQIETNVTVKAASYLYSGARTQPVSQLISWESTAGTHTRSAGAWTTAASGVSIYYPVDVPDGTTITGYGLQITKASSAACTHRLRLWKRDAHAAAAQVGSGDTEAGNAIGNVTLSESGLSEITNTGATYYIQWDMSVGPAAGDTVFSAYYTHTRPA